MIIFQYLTTWSLLQKLLHILTSLVALWSSHSELCERVCPGLKPSVLSARIKRKSQLLGFELFFIWLEENEFSSVQSLSRVQLCDPMNRSTPGLPVHHHLLEFTQTQVHLVSDAIQPSHPLSSPSPPAFNLSQHQGLFQWVGSLHKAAKGLEFQL